MQTYERKIAKMIGAMRVSTSGAHSAISPFLEVEFLLKNQFKPMADAGGTGGKIGAALHPDFYTGSWMDKKSWVAEVMMILFTIWPQGVVKVKALAGISIIPDESKRSRMVSTAIYLAKNVIVDISETPAAGQSTIAALRFMWPRISFLANKLTRDILLEKGIANEWVTTREGEYFAPCCLAGVSLTEASRFLNRWARNTSSEDLRRSILDAKYMQQLFKFADQLYLAEEKNFITKDMKLAVPTDSFYVSDEAFSMFKGEEVSVEIISQVDNRIKESAASAFAFEDDDMSVVSYGSGRSTLSSRWTVASVAKTSMEVNLTEIREALEEAGFSDDAMANLI